MNSRNVQFRDEILRATGGRGVDVVLNSLNGEFIAASLDVLAPGGRFVEIGKLGAWTHADVAVSRPDVSYFTFDLSDATTVSAADSTAVLTRVAEWLAAGEIQPPPTDVFRVHEIERAFRHLAQGKNVGKVVIQFPEVTSHDTAPLARGDRSYLITGGLGALGLEVAEYLVHEGARALILVGRRAPSSTVRQAIASLECRGARVEILQADVTDRARLTEAVTAALASLPPLAGVVHAAGVLDDAMLDEQTPERVRRVLAPKVMGARNLHGITSGMPLDWFVAFTSVSGVLGSAGQANYAAANRWLDAFMQHRRSRGLAGSSIAWGPWASIGMAANLGARRRTQLRSRGLQPLDVSRGLAAFKWIVLHDATPVVVASVDWGTFARHVRGPRPGILEDLVPAERTAGDLPWASLAALVGMEPREQRSALLQHVRNLLAATLGFTAADAVDPAASFADLGMDSLSAVEFAHQLEAGLAISIPETSLAEYDTAEQVVEFLVGWLATRGAAAPLAEAV
jgi:myxalamid-type polyketide synthase MxaB